MNVQNPFQMYDQACELVKKAVTMEKEGRHQEGFILVIIDMLVALRSLAGTIGKDANEMNIIDQLIANMKEKLESMEEDKAKPSGLEELL